MTNVWIIDDEESIRTICTSALEDLFKIAVSENNEEYFDQLLPETSMLLNISNKSRSNSKRWFHR